MNDPAAIDCLAALAHPVRMAVFRLLVREAPQGIAAGEIARRLDVPATTMSTNLGILARAGLIAAKRDGRTVHYSLDAETVSALFGFLVSNCCAGRSELCTPMLANVSRAACTV